MNPRFIGISGHLQSGAAGHFETFHKRLYRTLQNRLGTEEISFLGSVLDKEKRDTWFIPSVPLSSTSRVTWLPRTFINFLSSLETKRDHPVILYLYEGNLSWLIILGNILRKRRNYFLFINFFNSHKYNLLLSSARGRIFFRLVLNFASMGIRDRIRFTTDSVRLAEKISQVSGIEFEVFPIYSVASTKVYSHAKRNTTLINVRGSRAEKLLINALNRIEFSHDFNSLIHGVQDVGIKGALSELPNLILSEGHVHEEEYLRHYEYLNRAIFLYDPEFFNLQSSGRLADAISAGIEVAVPKNTALADFARNFNGVIEFDFENPQELIQIIQSAPKLDFSRAELPTCGRSIDKILSVVNEFEHFNFETNSDWSRIGSKIATTLMEIVWGALWLIRAGKGLSYRFRRH